MTSTGLITFVRFAIRSWIASDGIFAALFLEGSVYHGTAVVSEISRTYAYKHVNSLLVFLLLLLSFSCQIFKVIHLRRSWTEWLEIWHKGGVDQYPRAFFHFLKNDHKMILFKFFCDFLTKLFIWASCALVLSPKYSKFGMVVHGMFTYRTPLSFLVKNHFKMIYRGILCSIPTIWGVNDRTHGQLQATCV